MYSEGDVCAVQVDDRSRERYQKIHSQNAFFQRSVRSPVEVRSRPELYGGSEEKLYDRSHAPHQRHGKKDARAERPQKFHALVDIALLIPNLRTPRRRSACPIVRRRSFSISEI